VTTPATAPEPTAVPAGDAARLSKRERNKAANRAAILQAGREVFVDLGFGAANVRDIVRRTDLAAGTFYNYFPDKESVFRALVDESAEEIRVRAREARRRATTLEEFVAGGFRAYFEFVADDRDTLDLMRRNAGTIRTMFDEPAIGAGADELRADLEDAVAAGLLPDHDSEYMAAAMVGAGIEVALTMSQREPPDVEGATALVTRLFVAGLRADA
jgi:AcrR family transcriptional regulator